MYMFFYVCVYSDGPGAIINPASMCICILIVYAMNMRVCMTMHIDLYRGYAYGDWYNSVKVYVHHVA